MEELIRAEFGDRRKSKEEAKSLFAASAFAPTLTEAARIFPATPREFTVLKSKPRRSQNTIHSTRELSMKHLTLQEVIERINQALLLEKDQQTRPARMEDQPHRPEFYVPRITRRLANLKFSALSK